MKSIDIKKIGKNDFPTLEELINALEIERGATLHISSDFLEFYKIYSKYHNDFSPSRILELFKTAIGENGTILLPTYTWDFCHGLGFDIRDAKNNKTGALGTYALKNGFVRTKHPIYSYAVWGKDAKIYADMQNIDGWGDDSPFAKMLENDGIWIKFCARVSCTFTHFIAKHFGVPYRFSKEFSDFYTDENGIKEKRTYTMYVRDLDYKSPTTNYEREALRKPFADIDIYGIDLPIRKFKFKKLFNKDLAF